MLPISDFYKKISKTVDTSSLLNHPLQHNVKKKDFMIVQTKTNPLCGDSVTLYSNIHNNYLKDTIIKPKACIVVQYSVSLLLEHLSKYNNKDQLHTLCQSTNEYLWHNESNSELCSELDSFDDLKIFLTYIKNYLPARMHCASLPWEVLSSVLPQK